MAIKAIAKGLCSSSGCHCPGSPGRCIAIGVYLDMAIGVLISMEKEGLAVSFSP